MSQAIKDLLRAHVPAVTTSTAASDEGQRQSEQQSGQSATAAEASKPLDSNNNNHNNDDDDDDNNHDDDDDDDAMMVFILLFGECMSVCVHEVLAEALMQRALEEQEMAWNRSKIMLIGTGRAGKTGTMRSMLGHNDRAALGQEAFVQTASTVGIDNDWSCEVAQETTVVDGDATFEAGDNRWISSLTSTQVAI